MQFRRHAFTAGFLIAVAITAGVATDIVWNGGRLLCVASGQAGVEEACRPELVKTLSDRGFSPSGIIFGQRPPLGFNYWADRTFSSDFTFEDGPEALRVDGVMACQVARNAVHIEVVTASRPIRAS